MKQNNTMYAMIGLIMLTFATFVVGDSSLDM
jgi:hypothetical protein